MGLQMSEKIDVPNLTEAETEIMNVVWEKSPTTIRDIFEKIKKNKNVAYTTVATTVKILEDKKFLRSEKNGKAHTFYANIQKKDYSRFALRSLVNRFFDGMSSGLVMNLLSDKNLSDKEKQEIKKMFEEHL